MDPTELGFTPQRPVGWLAPLLLLSTGLRTLLALLFGAYLDKRELQNALDGSWFDHSVTDGDDFWFDYVADLGDGFHATYSVAWLLAQPQLELGGAALPRGRMLLMGGDQVYPLASGDGYESRTKGPYRAALPEPPADEPPPTLFALPGNHDWYDGLTAFLRLFARRKDGHIGGWQTRQRRSYFAVKLPNDWWLFAMDEQSGAYIDDPQLLYFERAAQHVRPEDRVILMTPSPKWVKAVDDPELYDATDYFLRTILAPTGAQVRVLVSGDLHHYARYSGPDRELITCGGGGAYLLATHQLKDEITVPPVGTLTRSRSRARKYALRSRFPDAATSRRMSWGVFHRAPTRNPGFVTMLGLVQTLTMLAMAGAASQGGSIQRLFTIPLSLMLFIILAGTVMFARPPGAAMANHARHWILGLAHGFAQIGLAVARHLGLVARAGPRLGLAGAVGGGRGDLRADHRVPVHPGVRALPGDRQLVQRQRQRAVRRPGHRGRQELPADAHRRRRHADHPSDRHRQDLPQMGRRPRRGGAFLLATAGRPAGRAPDRAADRRPIDPQL